MGYATLLVGSLLSLTARGMDNDLKKQNTLEFPYGESSVPPTVMTTTTIQPAATSISTASAAGPETISDGQIVSVVSAANDAEISAASLAKSRADNAEVRAFARHMVDAHTKNNVEEKTLFGRQWDNQSQTSEMSQSIRAEAETQLAQLQNMSGSSFDQKYLGQQIAMHKQLLSDLDQRYIPTAKDAKLIEFLKTTRLHVSQHLDSAQHILTSMGQSEE